MKITCPNCNNKDSQFITYSIQNIKPKSTETPVTFRMAKCGMCRRFFALEERTLNELWKVEHT